MKSLLLAFVLVSFSAFAQTPFEGTVRYEMTATGEKEKMNLMVHFAPGKLKLQFEGKMAGPYESYSLVNFDSGKIYTVFPENKSYKSRRLVVRRNESKVPAARTIAGYNTVEVSNGPTAIPPFLGGMGGEALFYRAEKLYFPVPDKYAGNMELMMVQNNNIILGADIDVNMNRSGGSDDEDNPSKAFAIKIEAKEVLPKKFTATDFTIPADFVKNKRYLRVTDSVDSATAYTTDTTFTVTTVEPQQLKKAPAKKPAKTLPAKPKTSAHRRKH